MKRFVLGLSLLLTATTASAGGMGGGSTQQGWVYVKLNGVTLTSLYLYGYQKVTLELIVVRTGNVQGYATGTAWYSDGIGPVPIPLEDITSGLSWNGSQSFTVVGESTALAGVGL